MFVLFSLCILCAAAFCEEPEVQPIINALFASTGHDCDLYVSLYTDDATYYHQHDGFKTKDQLAQNCKNYAAFCPDNACEFRQNGRPSIREHNGNCHVLVPYIWSEIPANNKISGNLEPHTGWEYLILSANDSFYRWSIKSFAEIETSYSVAFNWGNPTDVSVYSWTLKLLSSTASKGECDVPIAPIVTYHIQGLGGGTWRQQGSAVVLSVGGLCHVVVPYAVQLDSVLKTDYMVFVLQPMPPKNSTYTLLDMVTFF